MILGPIGITKGHENNSQLPFQINRKICQSLNIHAGDLTVEDQPGRAADGSIVAPADLPNSLQVQVPNKISIPVHLNIKSFSQPENPFYDLTLDQGDVGQIDIDTKSGKIYYNDQPLFNEQEQQIREACRHRNFH